MNQPIAPNPDHSNIPIIGKFFTFILTELGKLLKEEHYNCSMVYIVRITNVVLLIAALVGLTLGVVSWRVHSQDFYLLLGLGWLLVVPTLHYIADRFLRNNANLLDTVPSQISSTSLNVVTLLAAVGSFSYAVFMFIDAYRFLIDKGYFISIRSFFIGSLSLAIGWAVAVIAKVPHAVNVSIDKQFNVDREAIGILSFVLKTCYRLVPLIFCVGVLYVTSVLCLELYVLLQFKAEINPEQSMFIMDEGIYFLGILTIPVVAYVIFVFSYLLIDFIKAVLDLPKKFDNKNK